MTNAFKAMIEQVTAARIDAGLLVRYSHPHRKDPSKTATGTRGYSEATRQRMEAHIIEAKRCGELLEIVKPGDPEDPRSVA